MNRLEFDTEITEERTLKIPDELAAQVSAHDLVHVVLQPGDGMMPARAREEQEQALMATFGSCKDDASLTAIFEEIDRTRHADLGREVDTIE